MADKSRMFKPRATAALVVAPLLVSDENCAAVIGLEPRQFRELVAEHPNVRRIVRGHRLLVPAEDLVALAKPVDVDAMPDGPARPDDQPEDVDAVLRMVGRRRAG